MPSPARDRFDDISPSVGRVGAHRAENPRVRGWTTLLWAILATAVLVVVGILASLAAQGRLALFPEALPTPVVTASVVPVVDTSYSVLVLNGTPQDGLATDLKNELVAAGWTDSLVIASNASDRAFANTTVWYAAADAEAAALGLAELIGGAEVVFDPEYPLPGTPATQLTVLIGVDRAATPEPAE